MPVIIPGNSLSQAYSRCLPVRCVIKYKEVKVSGAYSCQSLYNATSWS